MALSKPKDSWYQYEFPLPEVKGAPVPSQADYSQQNVAWLIEFFASILAVDPARLMLLYENNTPDDTSDDILVPYINDGVSYLEERLDSIVDTPEIVHYNLKARRSSILKIFETYSPAEIEYFKNASFDYTPSFSLSSLRKTGLAESAFTEFEKLSRDEPLEYTSVALKWTDKATEADILGEVVLQIGESGDHKEDRYHLPQEYLGRRFVWTRGFTRDDINNLRFYHKSGDLTKVELIAKSLSLPVGRDTTSP